MKTLTKQLNVKLNTVHTAFMFRVHKTSKLNSYEQLCLICAELDIDLTPYPHEDFTDCVNKLDKEITELLDNTTEDSITVSVWFS